jgi:single-strand DNA-binding protein
MNKVILLGRIGKDLELRYTAGGTAVANTSLATSKKIKGEQVTQWHNLVFWDKTAELAAKYFKKGDPLSVEGEIEYRSYDTKDGEKKYITEIRVSQLHFVPGGAASAQSTERGAHGKPSPVSAGTQDSPYDTFDDSSIPF